MCSTSSNGSFVRIVTILLCNAGLLQNFAWRLFQWGNLLLCVSIFTCFESKLHRIWCFFQGGGFKPFGRPLSQQLKPPVLPAHPAVYLIFLFCIAKHCTALAKHCKVEVNIAKQVFGQCRAQSSASDVFEHHAWHSIAKPVDCYWCFVLKLSTIWTVQVKCGRHCIHST